MEKNNLQECEIIQDLLPLYYDNVCSPSSKEIVRQHLENCASCKKFYEELQNNSVDRIIGKETEGVLERHAKKERNAAYKAGLIISLLLLIPIIITLIITLSIGSGLDIFFVLAASMFLVAALTVIPLMTRQKKLAKSILTGSAALLLIIFFVDRMNGGSQFLFLSVPTVFGLSVCLFPFVIRGFSLPPVLADKKALITMIWDTAWLFLTIFVICTYSGDVEGLRVGNIIAAILVTAVWLIFLTVRYLPANGWIKAGIAAIITGVWGAFSNDFYTLFALHKKQITLLSADFSDWTSDFCINANIYLILLIVGIMFGVTLIIIGMVKQHK